MGFENVVTRKCSACGETETFLEVNKPEGTIVYDLDSRPNEPYRSTIENWIEACPKCNFCAPRIDQEIVGSKGTVESEDYEMQFHSVKYPQLANKFLCYSIIQVHEGNFSEAGWACVHAAWVCDDNEHNGSAELRIRAAELFEKALLKGQEVISERGGPGVLLIDLFRRAGEFGKAREYCDIGLSKEEDETVASIIKFESELIEKKDKGVYTVDDALR
jgi:hypothetical protein